MKNKIIRLSKALRYESAKRLPWIIALVILLGGFAFYQSYHKTAEGVQIARDNTTSLKNLGLQIKTLTEQNTELTKQNNKLATENAKHIDCIAKLFAYWTQTGTPVTTTDLNACVIEALSQGNSASGSVTGGTSAQIGSGASSSTSNSTPTANGSQQDNTQTKKSPSLTGRITNILEAPGRWLGGLLSQ